MRKNGPLEVWGGLECTFARIGDRVRDQIVETGHADRPQDLDRIAALGLRTLRYPIIWETIAPERPGLSDWSWHDGRLQRLQRLGIRPIAGLIHHGSGPRYTDLLDPAFPRLLARHAERVARRYPWIDLYTPVNEPLTTARFSALYGHWYPHRRDYGSFLRALVNQCRATILAMRAIRRVNPAAKLVQTDDFGKTFSTPAMAYQADHENERRWLSFDLLFGRIDRAHPWWRIFQDHGIGARELAFFLRAEAPPDIVGINHYLTSERFIDQRLARYPEHLWGGNGRDRYADVEAVRVNLPGGDLGPAARLREVWARYRAPIAVTEVHHGCTRDEQLRWLAEVWRAAATLRREGADVRAVTLWSLFGTTDWNTLLTRDTGIYEPGAFDVRGPEPRPTALAAAARSLARRGRFDHPVLDRPGWWRREQRFYRPLRTSPTAFAGDRPRSLLVLGGRGSLAEALQRVAAERGLDHSSLPAGDEARIEAAFAAQRPWAIVDLSDLARGTAAALAGRERVPYLALSGTPLFDGRLGRPYVENDPVSPRGQEGARAASRERRILAACPDALVIRTGPLFSPWDRDNFAFRMLETAATGRSAPGGRPVERGGDIVSPTYLPDLFHVMMDLLIDGEGGLRHLANGGSASWDELAAGLAARAGFAGSVGPTTSPDPGGRSYALATGRGALMPPLEAALDRFVRDCEPDWRIADGVFKVAAE